MYSNSQLQSDGLAEVVYRIRRRVDGRPKVSVVIPTRGSRGKVWGVDRIFVHDAVRSLLQPGGSSNDGDRDDASHGATEEGGGKWVHRSRWAGLKRGCVRITRPDILGSREISREASREKGVSVMGGRSNRATADRARLPVRRPC